MPKKNEKTEEEPIILDEPVEKKGIMDMEPEDLGAVEEPKKPEEKVKKEVKKIDTSDPNVSCKVIKKHFCVIGKVTYDLSEGKDVVLPNSVATILSTAGVVIKR